MIYTRVAFKKMINVKISILNCYSMIIRFLILLHTASVYVFPRGVRPVSSQSRPHCPQLWFEKLRYSRLPPVDAVETQLDLSS